MKLKDLFLYSKKENTNEFVLTHSEQSEKLKYKLERQEMESDLDQTISEELYANLDLLKKIFTYPKNGDIVIREFEVDLWGEISPAFAIFIDGMVDRSLISKAIIEPLLYIPHLGHQTDNGRRNSCDKKELIFKRLISVNQLKTEAGIKKAVEAVNFGCCVLFVDGLDECFISDVKMWEHRTVSKAENEQSIEGPKEAFNEILRINTALLRKILNTEKLVCENHIVGSQSKTVCTILYIKDIANEKLVEEARTRIDGVDVEYLLGSEELMQFIEERSFMLTPQMLTTERPDRVARVLTEGRIAIMVHGSPIALIAPANFFEFFHSVEDLYNRFFFANLVRTVRLIGVFLSIFLPAIYITLTLYNPQMIPTYLLYTIQASQANVPFSTIMEIVLMEIAFEIIREAGIRVPGPIGPTLGIIGALILGQASVAANIVSPVAIIVVAITGIGSFATTNYLMGLSFRCLKFVMIILVSFGGIIGLSLGIFLYSLVLVSAKSFGVPMLAPIAPKTAGIFGGSMFIPPIWKLSKRPDYLDTKRQYSQAKISRKWAKNRK